MSYFRDHQYKIISTISVLVYSLKELLSILMVGDSFFVQPLQMDKLFDLELPNLYSPLLTLWKDFKIKKMGKRDFYQ